jgi:hypothetical protein
MLDQRAKVFEALVELLLHQRWLMWSGLKYRDA